MFKKKHINLHYAICRVCDETCSALGYVANAIAIKNDKDLFFIVNGREYHIDISKLLKSDE